MLIDKIQYLHENQYENVNKNQTLIIFYLFIEILFRKMM